MAATDGQITLAASRFGDTLPVYLRLVEDVLHSKMKSYKLTSTEILQKLTYQPLQKSSKDNIKIWVCPLFQILHYKAQHYF